jgi:pimeloyl-ACP methyl ester carboxylesterase
MIAWAVASLALIGFLSSDSAAGPGPPVDLARRSLASFTAATRPKGQTARFIQVFPTPEEELTFQRRRGQVRAVVLIHGFHLPLVYRGGASKPIFQGWQRPGSLLVETLAADADLFAFAYCQNVAVEEVAHCPLLADSLARVRALGYRELVLVGHSAGGLIARQFVEDFPDAGVTKVVQVCAPNQGASLAEFEAAVPVNQRRFLHSLTPEARQAFGQQRNGIKVSPAIEFVCIVANGAILGDGIVPTDSQWPQDLRDQGIPATVLFISHFTAMRAKTGIDCLAETMRNVQGRVSAERIGLIRKELADKKIRLFASPF